MNSEKSIIPAHSDLSEFSRGTIVATSFFSTPLLTLQMGQSHISGLISLFRIRSHSSIVPGSTGLRLRLRRCSSQRDACCLSLETVFFLLLYDLVEVLDRITAAFQQVNEQIRDGCGEFRERGRSGSMHGHPDCTDKQGWISHEKIDYMNAETTKSFSRVAWLAQPLDFSIISSCLMEFLRAHATRLRLFASLPASTVTSRIPKPTPIFLRKS